MGTENGRPRKRIVYFSVEGYTEKWYLEWLERVINSSAETTTPVRFRVRVGTDPWSRAATLDRVPGDVTVYQLCDMESAEKTHLDRFRHILRRMRLAEERLGNVTYELAYCNYTFELWMLLHRMDADFRVRSRKDYLPLIERAYGEEFQGMHQYKSEKGFRRLIRKLKLENAMAAAERAAAIEQENCRSGSMEEYMGYLFCRQNPALSLGSCVQNILALSRAEKQRP